MDGGKSWSSLVITLWLSTNRSRQTARERRSYVPVGGDGVDQG
jgi:hypothetical protein